MKPSFRTVYSHDRAISALFGTVNNEDSMTEQSQAKDTDINVIMARYKITGQIPLPKIAPTYGDFTGLTDYRDALHRIRDANETFMQLPARIRAEFNNDPAAFVDFATNPANIDKMREMGLAKPKESVTMPLTPTPADMKKGEDNGSKQGGDSGLRGGETNPKQN